MIKIEISKKTKLILSIILDLLGMSTYLIPVVLEPLDMLWAPIAGLIMFAMYGGTKGMLAGVFVALEEVSPGLGDWIPSFTIMWLFTYVWNKPKVDKKIEI